MLPDLPADLQLWYTRAYVLLSLALALVLLVIVLYLAFDLIRAVLGGRRA